MKHIIQNIWVSLLLATFASCSSEALDIPQKMDSKERTISVVGSIVDDGLRAIEKDLNSDNVLLTWTKESFSISVFAKQNNVIVEIPNIQIKEVKDDARTAIFDVNLPDEIDTSSPFDLIGCVGQRVKLQDGKILVGVEAHSTYELFGFSDIKDEDVPVYFHAENVEVGKKVLNVNFIHLGAMAVVAVTNTFTQPLRTAGFAVVPEEGAEAFYYKAALPFEGNTDLPYLDLLNPDAEPVMIRSNVEYPEVVIPANSTRYVGFWFRPNGKKTPNVKLVVYDADKRQAISSAVIAGKNKTMVAGKAYNIYAEYAYGKLKTSSSKPTIQYDNSSYIEVKTDEDVGKTFSMIIDGGNPDDLRNIWIDLNNNGVRELGENIPSYKFSSDYESTPISFELKSQTFKIYGKVTYLSLDNNKINTIDVSKCKTITSLSLENNNLTSLNLTTNSNIEELFISGNATLNTLSLPNNYSSLILLLADNNKQLSMLDLSKQSNLILLQAQNCILNEVKMPISKYSYLPIKLKAVRLKQNQLPKDKLEAIFDGLPRKSYSTKDWEYTIDVRENSGIETADKTKATSKGWKFIE